MLDSVRMRLTLWHTGVLALTLVVFSVGVYSLLARELASRLDEGLRASVEGAVKLLALEIAEGESVTQSARSVVEELNFTRQAVAVFDAEGRLLAEKPLPGNLRARLPESSPSPPRDLRLGDVPGAGGGLRVAGQSTCVASNGPCYLVVVAQPRGELVEDLALLRNIFCLVIPLALLLAGVGGWFLARRSLAPVVAMSESARRISAEHLEQRLPVANPRDELGQLAATFNQMLARLHSSFVRQRQFMADASHELRTPLSVVRTAAEVTLEQPHRSEGEYREALTMIGEQVKRLTRIVEEMFLLARADAAESGGRELAPRDFYLDELIAETARAAAVLASRKGVSVEYAPAPETLYRGDEGLLRQMLLNLLDNAVKHTPGGGRVKLQFERADSTYFLTVADTGTGIPAEAQPHIFERFYRADRARTRTGNGNGGAGLGLSIARWIAEAHGGSLSLQHSDPAGSTFQVTLPMSRAY